MQGVAVLQVIGYLLTFQLGGVECEFAFLCYEVGLLLARYVAAGTDVQGVAVLQVVGYLFTFQFGGVKSEAAGWHTKDVGVHKNKVFGE